MLGAFGNLYLTPMRVRLLAAAAHAIASLVVVSAFAALIFGLWFPGAYRQLSGGQSLFWLIVSVDVVLGPLLTLVVFDAMKPRAELVRDLAVIAALQLAALGYGLYTMALGRPVHLVFEVDRFRVVSAADVDPRELPKAPEGLRSLPWTGPTVIAARRSRNSDELLAGVQAATAGVEISMQPERWMPYDAHARAAAWARAKPMTAAGTGPEPVQAGRKAVQDAVSELGIDPAQLRLLPVQSRFGTWSALLDERGEPLRLVPFDSF